MALGDQIEALAEGLNEIENIKFRNAILMENYAGINLRDNRRTLTNQRNGSKIPIILQEDDFGGFPTVSGCALPACDWDIPVSSFTWSIGEIGCEMEICLKNFTESFRAFWDTYLRMNEGDLNSAFVRYLVTLFQRKQRNAMFRNYYFGDTTAELSEGNPDTLINANDGVIKQYLAHGVNRVEIANNTEVETDGEVILGWLKELYESVAYKPWFNPADMKWEMNRELVNALVGYLNTENDFKGVSCECIDPNGVTQSRVFRVEGLRIYGIKVVPLPFTQAINAIDSYDGGTNIVILTREENDVLGFETEDALENFRIGYDERAREIWMQGSSMFGAGIPTDAFAIAI